MIEIFSERLKLSTPTIDDTSSIVELAGHPKISATTMNIPHPYKAKDAEKWIQIAHDALENQNGYVFAMRSRQHSGFMGGIGLRINQRFNHAELGYWVGVPYWNQGFGTEAVGRVIQFGFEELNLHKIFATYLIQNPASGQVMYKNGMVKEGTLKDHYRKDGEYKTIVQCRITRDEYNSPNP